MNRDQPATGPPLEAIPQDWPKASAEEKGIDMALAIDFIRLVMERRHDLCILIS